MNSDMTVKAQYCKVCRDQTDVAFNIDFKAVPVCESCATEITKQQVQWWSEQHSGDTK